MFLCLPKSRKITITEDIKINQTEKKMWKPSSGRLTFLPLDISWQLAYLIFSAWGAPVNQSEFRAWSHNACWLVIAAYLTMIHLVSSVNVSIYFKIIMIKIFLKYLFTFLKKNIYSLLKKYLFTFKLFI